MEPMANIRNNMTNNSTKNIGINIMVVNTSKIKMEIRFKDRNKLKIQKIKLNHQQTLQIKLSNKSHQDMINQHMDTINIITRIITIIMDSNQEQVILTPIINNSIIISNKYQRQEMKINKYRLIMKKQNKSLVNEATIQTN
jgi:hypothetical protein